MIGLFRHLSSSDESIADLVSSLFESPLSLLAELDSVVGWGSLANGSALGVSPVTAGAVVVASMYGSAALGTPIVVASASHSLGGIVFGIDSSGAPGAGKMLGWRMKATGAAGNGLEYGTRLNLDTNCLGKYKDRCWVMIFCLKTGC